ncbi:alpha/beta hydrolase [Aquisalimonas sp. APHAB1-3]|uniref:alpha/beta hydrolase n=1 Tax=Aquisalimonas sp. APHAB1-3 TaxID=3402080 RepID=UPI003AB0BEE9
MAVTIQQRTINGLAVDHAGEHGPRILFVHGSSGGSWYWHPFMGYFAERGYQCDALNLRGHGPNPTLPDLGRISLQDYVDEVRGVIDELGEVILVGHSMGGAIAQVLAQEMPLKAAVFAASAPVAGVKFRNPPMNLWFALHGLKSIPAMLRKKPIKPGFRVASKSVFNQCDPEQHRELWQRLTPESARVAVEVLKGEIAADLSRVTCPLLTVVGTEDGTTVPEMAREIADYHGTEYLEFPGHGHMFMIEPGWEACASQLDAWFRKAVGDQPEPAITAP